MIDIHNHILPGIDDGAKDLETSIRMADIAARDGITDIVATPHWLGAELTLAEIDAQVRSLNRHLFLREIPITVWPGAEVRADAVLLSDPVPTLGDSRMVLLEWTAGISVSAMAQIIAYLEQKAYQPVLAHPERNPEIMQNPGILKQLGSCPLPLQLTAGSLTGFWGEQAKACARHLLRRANVRFVASDAHDPDFRAPILSDTLHYLIRKKGADQAHCLVRDHAQSAIPAIRARNLHLVM